MTEIPQSERKLLADAERRLGRVVLLLAVAATGVATWQWGWEMAAAVACGGGLAFLNYRWIISVVDTLMRAQSVRVPRRTYFKLLVPLVLLGSLLYVTFSRSLLPMAGVMVGLLLLVPAVVAEAVYELVLTARR